tara:strand:+ start:213 stop:1553 length:1341 start_codon:yes stop_codon:yes gene_type:complete
MPIDPRISLGVQPIQLADPIARYGQLATIQNAQNQNALAQYQLGTAKREEQTLNALNEAYAKSYDPATGKINRNTLRETLARGGFGSKLPGIEKTLIELDKEELAQRETGFKVEKAKNEFIAQAKRDTSQNPSDANLTAFKEDLIANPLFNTAEKTQMAANVDRILAMPVDQRRSFMASQGASAGELKPTVQSVNRDGQTDVLSVPAFTGAPTTLTQLADVPLPEDVATQKKAIAKAGASNITQTTEKKYSEVFAGKMADTDITKMVTAEKAPQLAESANRIIDLVKQGNVFTGPVADVKLNIARALNVAGASNEEKIANTESLISATGKSTLDAIQSAGLGTGQGFTDKDLNFLKGIAGGTIQLTAQTLTELARLQHQTATRSAESWNKRVKQLPKSATEGTGLSVEPIKVPPLSPSAIFARNPKTGERRQSLDGGNTWTPVGGK